MPIRTKEVMLVQGRLTQVGFSFRSSKNHRSAVFLCSCGNRKAIFVESVVSGDSLSCGCLKSEVTAARSTTHGHSKRACQSSEYEIWCGMKKRCENQNHSRWANYGGRGISVCERWSNSFEAFLEDMGPRPANCSIDRIDNLNGNYEPSNCRWSSSKEQARNMRVNRLIEFNGKSQCMAAWAEELGINAATLCARLRLGWTVERTLTEPVQQQRRKAKFS